MSVASADEIKRPCPEYVPAPFDALHEQATLPDPFAFADGERTGSLRDWICRRAEIAAQVQEYQLGPLPGRPDEVAGSMHGDRLTVEVERDGTRASFDVTVRLPDGGTAPYPAIIVMSHPRFGQHTALDADGAITGQGVALLFFHNDLVAEQQDGSSRGKGLFYELYPGHPAGALMAWAWGVSRIVDALEATPGARIDATRVGVTGCSRNGKGALVAGAFDERIALTIVQESGAGGSSLWRVADARQRAWIDGGRQPENGAVQTLAQIVDENVWFRESFRRFGTNPGRLPYDQHMVIGLVAPRPLLVLDNSDYYWLGRESSYLGAVAARPIWLALGRGDRFAASQRGGHPHCTGLPDVELQLVASFVRRFLLLESAHEAGTVFTDAEYGDLREHWIGWSAPSLQ